MDNYNTGHGDVNVRGVLKPMTDKMTLYIDLTNGKDTNDGLRADHALFSMDKAAEMMPNYVDKDINIYVSGTYTVYGTGQWNEPLSNGYFGTKKYFFGGGKITITANGDFTTYNGLTGSVVMPTKVLGLIFQNVHCYMEVVGFEIVDGGKVFVERCSDMTFVKIITKGFTMDTASINARYIGIIDSTDDAFWVPVECSLTLQYISSNTNYVQRLVYAEGGVVYIMGTAPLKNTFPRVRTANAIPDGGQVLWSGFDQISGLLV